MIILPDKNISRSKFLLPLAKNKWITPSQAQPKSQMGHENKTRFRIQARLNDGFVIWKGWFDDREDFDAFLWSLVNKTLKFERELWDLCLPNWSPDLGEHLSYEFATVTFLTSPTGSNQTYNRPIDWNNSSNSIDCIGGGAGGGAGQAGTQQSTGGGGGGYSEINNLSLGSTATYQLGNGGTGGQTSGASGGTGGDTWFNASTFALSSVGAKGGTAGSVAIIPDAGRQGGQASAGIGTLKYSGGNSGGVPSGSFNGGSGGGGAAGPNGNGGNGGNTSASLTGGGGGGNGGGTNGGNSGSSGGNGGNNSSGTGGAVGGTGAGANGTNGGGGAGGGASTSPRAGGTGGNGIEWTTVGSGGGGGGAGSPTSQSATVTPTGGNGGSYGGGGGAGWVSSGWGRGGNGIQGLIVVTYTPLVLVNTNMPNLGM
jgi:hypothetical protein